MLKARYLFAALFLILELPVLAPLIVGALITGLIRGLAVIWSHARGADLRLRRPVRKADGKPLAGAVLGS